MDPRLIRAIEAGDLITVESFASRGVDINADNNFAIRSAADNGYLNMVEFLFEDGADIHAVGEDPLCSAAQNGHLAVVQFLVSRGANFHFNNEEASRLASKRGHLAVVQFLVENGANFHVNNEEALHLASQNGHLNVVEFLVAHDVDLHALNDNALRLASENGQLNVVEFLVSRGADLHALNDNALRLAALNGHLAVVQFLVENGSDLHALNDDALCGAAQDGHLGVVQFLVENGADLHAQNDYALCAAAQDGHLDVVQFLVFHGTDIHAQNNYPLRSARHNGHLDVVEFLLSHSSLSSDSPTFNSLYLSCSNSSDPITLDVFDSYNSWPVYRPTNSCISPSTIRRWWSEKGASRNLQIGDDNWELWQTDSDEYKKLFNYQGCKEEHPTCQELWSRKLQEESDLTDEEIEEIINVVKILLGLDVEGLRKFIEEEQGHELTEEQRKDFNNYVRANNLRVITAERNPFGWRPSLEPLNLGKTIKDEYTIRREITMHKFREWLEEHEKVANMDVNGKTVMERANRCVREGDCITVFGAGLRSKMLTLYEINILPERY